MKIKNFILMILGIAALLCIGLYLRQKLNFTYFGSVKKSENLIYDEVYYNTFDLISIENDGYADIVIKETDEPSVNVKVYANRDNLEYIKDDNNIKIKSKSKTCSIFCDEETSVIEINLPRTYSNKIEINSDVGPVTIGEFDNSIIDLKVDTGDVKIKAAKDLNIDSDAGIIYIDRVNGKLNLVNDTGDISIDNLLVTEDSYIETDVGNINILRTSNIKIVTKNGSRLSNIKTSNEESNVTLTISTDIGEINVLN